MFWIMFYLSFQKVWIFFWYLLKESASANNEDIIDDVGKLSKAEMNCLDEIKATYPLGGRRWLTLTGELAAEYFRILRHNNTVDELRSSNSWGTP
ncbi:Uncharacterised protein [uncultured archaeon]|nr:Uncharacterised protein [uncultured archaeon]